MKRRLILGSLLLGLAVAGLAGIFVHRMMQPPPSGLDMSLTRNTDRGLYRVVATPSQPPSSSGQIHSWRIDLATPDGAPVPGAAITVDGGMPQHGHGLPTEPQAKADGAPGSYLIEGVKFNMGGWWELKLTIDAPVGKDTVAFNVVLD